MSQYRKVKSLSSEDAAYIAGLIDGEGTITLTQEHPGENRRPIVSISNNERALLEFVRESVGAGHITNKRTYSENHAPSFTYKLTSRQAIDLLKQVVLFLKSYKAKRAMLVLERYHSVTPRNGRYTEALREARESFEQEFLGIKP